GYSNTQTVSSLNGGHSASVTFGSVTLPTVEDNIDPSIERLAGDSYTYNNRILHPVSITSASTGSVAVTAPDTGATLTAGSTYTVTWTKDTVTNVQLQFSADNGATWETVHSNHSGTSYLWTVPGIATTQGRIRVSDRYNAATNDMSDTT